MKILNRTETEDLVRDLYFNQKKTFREVQKIVRKSPRDIKAIIDRTDPEKSSLSVPSQAYQMFKDNYAPTDVAIALDIRQNALTEYYSEYLVLSGRCWLNQIYEEVKDDIWTVIELYNRMKSEGLSPQQVIRILRRTRLLECNVSDLESEQSMLEERNKHAAWIFQQFTDLRIKDSKILEQNRLVYDKLNREIENLKAEEARLKNTINSLWMNNRACIRIRHIVKHEMESILSNPRMLLRLALVSLFESERTNRGKLRALYYNTFPPLSVEQILLFRMNCQNEQSTDQFGSNEDSLERLLLDEAEQLFNRIAEAWTRKSTNDIIIDTGSLCPIPRLLDILPNQFTEVVSDTPKRESDKRLLDHGSDC